MNVSPAFSLEKLYQKVSEVLVNNLSLFQGLTLTNISIDKTLKPHHVWQQVFYTGTSKESVKNKNYSVTLKISNTLINTYRKECGNEIPSNASYDILIESLSVSPFGTITITVGGIKETGISERELLKRRLTKYCEKHKFFDRKKKEMPHLVTSILALTSQYSEIHDDLLSNLTLHPSRVNVVNCKDTKEIASYIDDAKANDYDLIVLYRGGREDEAMSMFSSEEIINAITKSNIPVCAALGHDMDIPFIYSIADKTYSTPSAFGKAISAHNLSVKESNSAILLGIGNTLEIIKEKIHVKYTKTFDYIESTSKRLYEKVNARINKLLEDSENSVVRIADSTLSIIYLTNEKIEQSIQQIHQSRDSNVDKIETAIEYNFQNIYRNRLGYIQGTFDEIESYVRELQQHERNLKKLLEEKRSKHTTIIIFTLVITLMLGIIIALLL